MISQLFQAASWARYSATLSGFASSKKKAGQFGRRVNATEPRFVLITLANAYSVFTGVSSDLSSETLLDALQGGGGPGLVGAEKILLRAAVAALLNSDSVAYPFATADIISSVNAAIATGDRNAILALATLLDNANNGQSGCPLS